MSEHKHQMSEEDYGPAPVPPPRADELYHVQFQDIRCAVISISMGVVLYGLLQCVSLLTGPVIAGTFGGVTLLITGGLAAKWSVGSVLMFPTYPPRIHLQQQF